MKYYDQPAHPASRFLVFVALLLGLGIAVEGYNQVQGYFDTKAIAAPVAFTEGKTQSEAAPQQP